MGMNETNAQTEQDMEGQPEEEFSYKGYQSMRPASVSFRIQSMSSSL